MRASTSPAKPAPAEMPHGQIRMAQVLGAFSLATDLGMSQPMGHALRACYIGMAIARARGLAATDQATLYYSFLLMHSGCSASSEAFATIFQSDEIETGRAMSRINPYHADELLKFIVQNVAPDAPVPARVRAVIEAFARAPSMLPEGQRATCEVGVLMAQRLGLPPSVGETLRNLFERWDGKGPNHLRGEQLPLGAGFVDACSMLEIFHAARGREGALELAREQRGKAFAPEVADGFMAVGEKDDFWAELSREDLQEVVLELEPDTPSKFIGAEKFDDLIMAFADFADVKSVATLGHSKATARTAEAIAHQLGLAESEALTIRRAALVHDLGHVAMSRRSFDATRTLTPAEQEKLRLHPYFTERILSTVPPLRPLAAIAGAHHEWMNGQGYYRGLSGEQVPLGARILAVADEYDHRVEGRAGHAPMEPLDALNAIQKQVGARFAPECYEALCQVSGVVVKHATTRRALPAGLTEREVEVLRAVAKGFKSREIAQQLFVSEKTVGHHIEHIYNKVGISTRAAATFFALEHGLVS